MLVPRYTQNPLSVVGFSIVLNRGAWPISRRVRWRLIQKFRSVYTFFSDVSLIVKVDSKTRLEGIIGIVILGGLAPFFAWIMPSIDVNISFFINFVIGAAGLILIFVFSFFSEIVDDRYGVRYVAPFIITPVATLIIIFLIFLAIDAVSDLSSIDQQVRQAYFITIFISGMSFIAGNYILD